MAHQHASLGPERWSRFTLDQQVLMVGNEMLRASRSYAGGHLESVRKSYERVLNLIDLTITVNPKPTLRRELLRWRDLVAALYVSDAPDPEEHRAAFRCLLTLTREAYKQIPYVLDVNASRTSQAKDPP